MKFSYRFFLKVLSCWMVFAVCYWLVVYRSWMTSQSQALLTHLTDKLYLESGVAVTKGDVSNTAAVIFPFQSKVHHQNCSSVRPQRIKRPGDIDSFQLLHDIDGIYSESWSKDSNVAAKAIDQKLVSAGKSVASSEPPLHVIVLPHSHCDPGWLKTVDEYYEDQVQHILNNMLNKLTKYPDMTFVWAETVFFSMWWETLDSRQRDDVRRLLKRGQLELVVGSWVVPDEANPHYFALIDQMIEGHQWLLNNVGVRPTNTWSLDPFGYSSTLPYLYKKAGFENLAILRVHQHMKHYLESSRELEFYWQQQWDDLERNGIFTSMLPYSLYSIKHQCGPDPASCLMFDFRRIHYEYTEATAKNVSAANLDSLSKLLLAQYRKKSALFKHNTLLVPIGDDFRFDRELEWEQQYHNYTKLFNYINSKPELGVRVHFGTLGEYFRAVKNDSVVPKPKFSSFVGDFFPYSDRGEDYWTGFFSTRAYDKSYGRQLEQYLRAADMLNLFAKWQTGQFGAFDANVELLQSARRTLALFQHHDAITGTSRRHVVIDMEQRMYTALQACTSAVARAEQYLLATSKRDADALQFTVQQPAAMSLLHPTKHLLDSSSARHVTVVLFNPSAQYREDVVRVTVDSDRVDVYDSSDRVVLSQLNPLWQSARDMYKNAFELAFIATVPPLAVSRYKIVFLPETATPVANFAAYLSFGNFGATALASSRFKVVPPRSETVMLENEYLRARFSARSGLLKSLTTKTKLSTSTIFSELLMYKSRRSGAYIFEPTGPATDTEMLNTPPVQVVKGPVVSELRLTQRDDVITHTVRLCNCSGILGSVLDIVNVANLAKFDDHELIMRFTAPDVAAEDGVFFTDSNGFSAVKRRRFTNLPRQANYYPMASYAYVEDERQRVSLLSAQPLGVSSQERRSLEVMLDRRLLYDDGRGMSEGVRDTKRTPSHFYLLVERRSSEFDGVAGDGGPRAADAPTASAAPSLHAHALIQHLQQQLIVSTYTAAERTSVAVTSLLPEQLSLRGELPPDTLLLSLRTLPERGTSAALVLHQLGHDCRFPTLSFQRGSQRQIDIYSIFSNVHIKTVRQMSLSFMYDMDVVSSNATLKLDPMELYAFEIQF